MANSLYGLHSALPRRLTRRTWARQVAALGAASGAFWAERAVAALDRPAPQGTSATRFHGVPERIVDIQATLDHPQGIEASADGQTWWVSAVHRPRRVGLLAACDATSGQVHRVVEVQVGERYHPGGLSRAGTHLWLPVAEYRRDSSSSLQCRDAGTLDLLASFEMDDHIGCLAADGSQLVGANWDARTFYAWTPDGRQVDRRANPTAARYQDLKWRDGRLIAGGLLDAEGVIDVLTWPSLALEQRIVMGRTDRGAVYTHEGLALSPASLLLMPEDDPSRVFVFPRPAGL